MSVLVKIVTDVLWIHQTEGCPEQGPPLRKHQPQNSRNDTAQCDLDEVWSTEEINVEGKAW